SPNVAVITSIGEAHLEGLGDLHAVAAEKTSLLRSVRPAGFAVVNVDRPEILPYLAAAGRTRLLTFGVDQSAKLCVTPRRADLFGTAFELEGRYHVELPMPGAHHATNAAAAFAVARWFGVAPERIVERLRSFRPPQGRTELEEVGGVKLVDDAYNANPASVRAAVEALCAAENGRRVFVLGDMLELGVDSAASHGRVIRAALEAGIEVLVAVGPATVEAARAHALDRKGTEVHCCADALSANVLLDGLVVAGDTVWIKGSRGMQLDGVVRHLRGRLLSRPIHGAGKPTA
ncbi:MAG: Mur ligase family protein, partial [Planctomycetota bacterium]